MHIMSLAHLQASHVPKYIPQSCPSKILDIGRAVRLLRHNPFDSGAAPSSRQPRWSWAPRDPARAAAADRSGQGDGGDAFLRRAVVPPDEAVLAPGEITELTAELQKLAAAPVFSGIVFEGTIDRLHEKVRQRCLRD